MRKRTRRKVYALMNPITYAIEGACVTSDEHLNKLRIRELAAIDAFAKGKATLTDWRDINDMLTVAETMARNGIGVEVLDACKVAQQHLIDAARRFESTGRMGTTGPGLTAFRDLYAWHDLQRTSVARAEYERQIAIATNRVRAKAPEVTVL